MKQKMHLLITLPNIWRFFLIGIANPWVYVSAIITAFAMKGDYYVLAIVGVCINALFCAGVIVFATPKKKTHAKHIPTADLFHALYDATAFTRDLVFRLFLGIMVGLPLLIGLFIILTSANPVYFVMFMLIAIGEMINDSTLSLLISLVLYIAFVLPLITMQIIGAYREKCRALINHMPT